MAYGSATLASAETTGFNNDKPMFVVQKLGVLATPSTARWTEADGETTDTDRTAAGYPSSRAYDDFGSVLTKDTASTDTAKYYVLGLGAFNISFDTLLILGHNFNSVGVDSVALELSDSADFATDPSDNTIEIFKHTRGSATVDNRILCTNLNNEADDSSLSGTTDNAYSAGGTPRRYNTVRYARLKIVTDGSTSRQMEMGELILGYRYQLQRNPNTPWDNKGQTSIITDFRSQSGLTRRYVMNRGQAVRAFAAGMATTAEITVIDEWYAAIDEGTRNFVYIETPSSSPQAHLMFMEDAIKNFALVGPIQSQFQANLSILLCARLSLVRSKLG